MPLRRFVLLITLFAVTACKTPIQPSPPSGLVLPDALQPVLAYLDSSDWRSPLIGDVVPGVYVRRHVRQIVFDDTIPADVAAWAEYNTGRIRWRPTYVPPSHAVRSLAALLLHEARHLHGFRHSCDPNDLTLEEGGPWAVQILFLDYYGVSEASWLRTNRIGC